MSNKRQDIYRGHKEKGMWWLDELSTSILAGQIIVITGQKQKHLKSVMLNAECAKIKKTRFNKN